MHTKGTAYDLLALSRLAAIALTGTLSSSCMLLNPHREVEAQAVPSESHPLAGFWKASCDDPEEDFGLAIGPMGSDTYYVSFCGPGGCFAKGDYRPITKLVGDPKYRVLDNDTIEVRVPFVPS